MALWRLDGSGIATVTSRPVSLTLSAIGSSLGKPLNRNNAMQQTLCWMPALMLAIVAANLCSASEKETKPEITITLKQPEAGLVLGQPIQLTVVFQNNLKRDVQIEGFHPETGHYISGHMVCADGPRGGAVTSRTVIATTKIGVERLSGKSTEDDTVWDMGRSEARSFLLKAGASQEYSFDLMQTIDGAYTITSPGRFKVSLVFKVKGVASKAYRHDPLEWEGETRANPIEINVIGKETITQRPNKPSPASSASRARAAQ
jgi:hypothetical protein